MTETKRGFIATIKSYPSTFWVANTMEIFERMAWYGFFAVSSLYITGPTETGGLGFTSEERGLLQAIVPFFLYLFPVVTGALADRYGYKKMFIIAYLGMIVSYYALGQFKTFPTFLGAFMLVAVAAAIFKPVVVGTVARVTDESNSAIGFGVFYMMVNIGGLFGPFVAGAVRGISWNYVFIACSAWAAVNLLIVLIFYKDPSTEAGSAEARTLQKVLDDTVEVLGNLRFFIAVMVPLLAIVLAGFEFDWFLFWPHFVVFVPCWIALNFLWDMLLPAGSGRPVSKGGTRRPFFLKRMYCSNWRFALFLLIMSGFWTSFQQIFISMPEYIRDYTNTKPMVDLGRKAFTAIGKPHWISALAAIEETELLGEFDGLMRNARGIDSMVPAKPKKTPTKESLSEKRRSVLKDLRKLENDENLQESGLKKIESTIASLTKDDDKPVKEASISEMESLIDEASKVVESTKRSIRIEKLPKDPSLTKNDLETLRLLLDEINTQNATSPLEVVDLVESARTILQYKVRIQPTELGELMTKIPQRTESVADGDLDTAVKTINARLKLLGKPEFEEAETDPLKTELRNLLIQHGPLVPQDPVALACERLSTEKRELEPKVLALGVRDLAYRPHIWSRMDAGRQVNPEHIVNFDAGAIVLLQVIISFLMAKFHRFTTMIVGMMIAAIGIGLSAVAGGTMIGPAGGLLIVVIAGIVTFAIGEMMASPTSQEYVGRIAPRDKVALYMGYYFVAIALGNLFSGVISGQLYGKLARDMQRPDLMWLAFGGIMLATAIIFLLYNQFALPKHAADTLTPDESAA